MKKSINLRFQIVLSFAIVALSFMVVIAVYQYTLFTVGKKYDYLVEVVSEKKDLSQKIHSNYLQLHLYEQIYLSTFDDIYLTKIQNNYQSLHYNLNKLLDVDELLNNDDSIADEFRKAVVLQKEAFENIRELKDKTQINLKDSTRNLYDESFNTLEKLLFYSDSKQLYKNFIDVDKYIKLYSLVSEKQSGDFSSKLEELDPDLFNSLFSDAILDFKINAANLYKVVSEINIKLEEYKKSITEIEPLLNQNEIQSNIYENDELTSINNWTDKTMFITLSILVLDLIFVVFIVLWMRRGIARPSSIILKIMNKISKGDLSEKAEYNYDNEMGHICLNINKAIETLKNLITEIKDSSLRSTTMGETISSISTETSAAMIQTSANLKMIKEQVTHLVNEITNSNSSSFRINEKANQFTQLVSDQSSALEQSTASIEEMIASIQNVNNIASEKSKIADSLTVLTKEGGEKIENTSSIIKEISVLTSEILEIISVINSISSQTNLLAMNAAIEAAHAGDAGKGFSVVADEIRKLAESTSDNSKKINQSLKVIVNKIEQALKVSHESNESFDSVNQEVTDMTNALHEIVSFMSEMSIGSKEVLGAANSLSEITSQIKDGALIISSETEEISDALTKMDSLVTEIDSGITEVTLSGEEIARSSETLSEQSVKNMESARKLQEKSDLFRLE